jgi:hypothetical protein
MIDQDVMKIVKQLSFDVFGRDVLVVRRDEKWSVLYVGLDGKRLPADDIIIPPDARESEIERWLADLCHEWSTQSRPSVKRLDK